MHLNPSLRRASRVSALALATGLALVAAPAQGDPPASWEDTQREAPLSDLIFLIGAPIAVIALICLLVYLPSMVRRQGSDRTAAFGEPEWFGGPRAGLEGSEQAALPAEESRGGASARW